MKTVKTWKEPFDFLDIVSHRDPRGFLFEILRFEDYSIPAGGLLYTFSIEPQMRRGDHYHLRKQEWFTCVHGTAMVLLTSKDGKNEMIEISPESPRIVYAAPGTTHALINRKREVAVIVSYGSKQHDPDDEDTYRRIAFEGCGQQF